MWSAAFRTPDGWIIRVPKAAEAAQRHANEARLLPWISTRLPVAVPLPVRALDACAAAPFGAHAYRELPGRVMTEADLSGMGGALLAEDLAKALASLHRIPPVEAVERAVPAFPGQFTELRSVVSPGLRARLVSSEWSKVDAWWVQFLADESLKRWPLAVTHGDVWWGNLITHAGRLSGIIDWEFLSIGDPAWDLASARQMGDAFYRRLLDAYTAIAPLDDGAGHRMDQWWALRVFFGIRFATDREDEQEWADSLRKLRDGPILV